ncbi:hypothetical protein M406DRAFT_249805 [Cryphonectria parasitica EP155]|uniref:F-box domain-containing protein n=1 Tax=Cryphonectria parasitica (strain ATCC 38755 / EP155) TaxID=660469 RepID=A0A9P4Y9L2_CRYP1|nr:uncharacterized protein M406DRAFT_249805 [Cryphonectria parasitica EP155]KAF3769333.1 hypothetical protein M406DRAFT_249805 [Cryphonectria parasitica EP155]
MIKQVRVQRPGPNEVFTKLPDEVLRMILDHLKVLHLEERSTSCATCWMRDCCSITVCNRRLLYAARAVLYDEIQLVGPDSAVQRKKYKGVYSTRLVLLRRTLRSNPKIASTVRALKVPALADEAPLEPESYHDIVASVVMACPNLERLQGFYPTYNHSDSRIFQALSTRTKLKEMTWVVDAEPTEPEGQQQARLSKIKGRPQSRHASYSMGSGRPSHSLNYLPVQLANNFVRQHMEWTELSHLTIHCLPGANLYTPNDLLGVIVTYLPSLQSLYLSDIPAVSFNDSTLLALPKPLKRLGLVRCAGVTTAGLTTFATHDSAKELETLTLIHQNVDSLPAIVRIFSNLSNLTTFSLVQTLAPTPDDDFFCFMPYVASQSLKMLHWDIFESGLNTADRNGEGAGTSGPTRADALLARSIAANGFPNLRFLRTPCDTGGLFQALCRPKERVELLGDRFRTGLINQASSTTPGGTRPSHRSVNSFSSSSKAIDPSAAGSDLHQARLAAQARLEAARRLPRIEVNIQDEDGVIIESSGLAAYIGDVTSRITYLLTPDHGGTDERGGLVGVAELLSDGGEDLAGEATKVIDGCTGRWNSYNCDRSASAKSSEDAWWHTERGRWKNPSQLS